MELRDYQLKSIQSVENEWKKGNLRTLLVLPTGCGKTIVFSKIAENCVKKGERVLILAHRGELLNQARDKIFKSTGLGCSVEKANETCIGKWFRIIVGSVQTLMRESRLERFPQDYFDTIIIDEAHHCISDSYNKVLSHFNGAKVLGVTATADRTDRRNLGQYFQSLAFQYGLLEAINNGYLCKFKAQTIPIKIDLNGVGMTAGDFKSADLGSVLDPYLERISEEMAKVCLNRKTIVFLPLIKTSIKFRDLLNKQGFNAVEINGKSENRDRILKEFESGKYNVLCNSMLLTEGFDEPSIDCVVVLRATKSRSLYSQMIGRGSRLSPGKDHLLILDFLWMIEKHNLCHPAHLIASTEDIAQAMTKNIESAGGPVDIDEKAVAKASDDVLLQREMALAEKLKEMRHRKRSLVDPLQYAFSIRDEDLSDYQPSFGAELFPPTDKQLKALEKLGIYPDQIDSSGKAQMILDRLENRRIAGLATPKQIRFLENRGFSEVGTWKFESAKKMISRIAASNWQVPRGIDPYKYKPEGN